MNTWLSMNPHARLMSIFTEFNYNPLLGRTELEKYLATVSREMQTLRRIRHPNIACVTGHFKTGMSLVQVSDWFDGRGIEESWAMVKTLSLDDKLALMVEISRSFGILSPEECVSQEHPCRERSAKRRLQRDTP